MADDAPAHTEESAPSSGVPTGASDCWRRAWTCSAARAGARTTVRGVCARAGLTERYFYESFKDREELLLTVYDGIVGEAAEVVLRAVGDAPHDAREKSKAALSAFVDLMTADPRKGRVAFIEAMGSEALMARRLETLRVFGQLIAQQAREFYGPSAVTATDAELTAQLLVGGVAETLISWLDGELDVSRERLVEHSAELFVAAAGVSSEPARASGALTGASRPDRGGGGDGAAVSFRATRPRPQARLSTKPSDRASTSSDAAGQSQPGTSSFSSRWRNSFSSANSLVKLAGASIAGAGIAVSSFARTGSPSSARSLCRRTSTLALPSIGSGSVER